MLQGHSTREVRIGDKPTISVLLTSTGQRSRLESCLEQLLPVCADLDAELVVVRAYNDQELAEMRAAFPGVRFTAAPAGSTVPELRAIGMAGADGDIVVLGDDASMTTTELVERLLPTRRNDQDRVHPS